MVSILKKIGLLSIASILLIPIMSSQSFGEEPLSDYSFWQLIYITKDRCLIQQEQLVKQYSELVTKYLELYQFDNYGFEPKCFSIDDYPTYAKPYSVDLTILVFDNYLGNQLLQKNDIDSLYAHFGNNKANNHVIMIAEQPPYHSSLDSTSIGWDASHQLSHFILSFKGYNQNTIERLLHSNPLGFDNCVGKRVSDPICNEVRNYMRTDNGAREFVVMTPLQELIGDGLAKYIPQDVISSKVVRDLHKDITSWWLNGIIDDELYLKTTKHIIDVPMISDSKSNTSIIKTHSGFVMIDEYKNTSVDWQDGRFNAFGTDYGSEYQIQEIFQYIPFNTEIEIIEEKQKIPSWFKERAEIWSEGKLGDKIFYDGLDALIRNGILN